MKVIFLDIDGVLNATDYMNSMYMAHRHKGKIDECRDKYGHVFDPRCVNFLEYIISKTGAKIVISSTWRMSGLQVMKDMWKDRGLPGEVIDITPKGYRLGFDDKRDSDDEYITRGLEVQEWLKHHPEVDKYIIIDDDKDFLEEQKINCIFTEHRFGITYSDTIKAVTLLS